MYTKIEKPKESRAADNPTTKNKSNSKQGSKIADNRPVTIAQKKLQQVMQMKWSAINEAEAQKKLMPIHNRVINVPTWNVLDQQAWAGLGNKGRAVQWGASKYRDLLQSIDADKVVTRAAEIMEGKVTVEPPPVAFSTETAADADPQEGELVLLDSHHTVNAARILLKEDTIPVRHNAKPDAKGNTTNAEIAASRAVLTKNKNIARRYNQTEAGLDALHQAQDEIMKLTIKASQERRFAEDSHKARSYDFQNSSDLKH